MGFERDPDYQGIETVPFGYTATLAAGKGIVFGVDDGTSPGDWTDVQPGATGYSQTGCCFRSFRIKNTGATNALTLAYTQTDAAEGTPRSVTLDPGETKEEREPAVFAKVAAFSASGTEVQFDCVCIRRANYRDAGTQSPAGHPGQFSPLTGDIDWITADSTLYTGDRTRY